MTTELNLRDYLSPEQTRQLDAGGKVLDITEPLQRAINDCPPGWRVRIPRGWFDLLGTVRLRPDAGVSGEA